MELKVIGELMVGIEVMAHKFIILEKDGAGFQVENKRVLKKNTFKKKTKNVFQDELSSIIQVLQKKKAKVLPCTDLEALKTMSLIKRLYEY